MRIFKRTVPDIEANLDNTNKYFNQFDFKGIVEPSNIFSVNENSFEDTKNVYIDEGQLISRDPLQKDITVPKDAIPYLYDLIDYLVIGDSEIYISKNKDNNNIIINLFNDGNIYTLDNITKYHISDIEHYIICFNDVDAKVFDASDPTSGWQDLDNFVDIPVTKRIVGNQITEYPANGFTDSYKEEYVWSNESHPTLPDISGLDPQPDVEMELITSNQTYAITGSDFSKGTEYKTIRKINFKVLDDDIVSIANDIIVIARTDHFYISYNTVNFKKVYYPAYSGTFLKIASISKNGHYFFFVTSAGVYRCNLADFTWAKLTYPVEEVDKSEIAITGESYNGAFTFLNDTTYCFITIEEVLSGDFIDYNILHFWISTPQSIIDDRRYVARRNYFIPKAETIDIETFNSQFKEELIAQFKNCVSIGYDMNNDISYVICLPIIKYTNTNYKIDTNIYYFHAKLDPLTISGFTLPYSLSSDIDMPFNRLVPISISATPSLVGFGGEELKVAIQLTAFAQDSSENDTVRDNWFESIWIIGITADTSNTPYVDIGKYTNTFVTPYLPFKLSGGYYSDMKVYSLYRDDLVSAEYVTLPTAIDGVTLDLGADTVKGTWASGDNFYLLGPDNIIYTNYMTDSESAIITYTYLKNTKFTKIPNISYSDTELYLAFGDTLQITENNRDGTKILFNLPPKNNQSFINNITNMVNISTTELAIFFENKIVICSKVEDENFNYRYDYYNTKLSLGVRLGDSTINTLEGAYTIFPTRRGLAVMNYQAFMSTTDQTIEYISDDIKNIWTKFYEESSIIKIIQWRNHLIFTNGTNKILLYRIDAQSWWLWEIPFNTQIAITDQLDLKLICRGELNVFTDKYVINNDIKQLNYYDFSAVGENIPINWYIQSQPLHLNAPAYYKNLKQLIFQFFTDNENTEASTMLAQIKLYRKKINLKEPETINFKIERLRTFVKRFNYWKINQLQWGLANDIDTNSPTKFRLNGLSIKYEIGEEVR